MRSCLLPHLALNIDDPMSHNAFQKKLAFSSPASIRVSSVGFVSCVIFFLDTSSANQRIQTESWLFHDKHSENAAATARRLACHLYSQELRGSGRHRPAGPCSCLIGLAFSFGQLRFLGWAEDILKMLPGQPVVRCPSPGPTLSPKTLSSFAPPGGPEAVKGKGSLRLWLGLDSQLPGVSWGQARVESERGEWPTVGEIQ